jgi:hypothetical protein
VHFAAVCRGSYMTTARPGCWARQAIGTVPPPPTDCAFHQLLSEEEISVPMEILITRSRLRMQVVERCLCSRMVQTLYGAHPASCAVGSEDVTARTWSWLLTPHLLSMLRISGDIFIAPTCIYGVVRGSFTFCSKVAVINSHGTVFSIANVSRDEPARVRERYMDWHQWKHRGTGWQNSRRTGINTELYYRHLMIGVCFKNPNFQINT